MPRGGVPVAYEVARTLDLPLDVFLVRKLGLPGQTELAMGAIASGGVRVVNEAVCLVTPEPFFGVGRWYEDFSPTSDAEVRALLQRAGQERSEREHEPSPKRLVPAGPIAE